MPKIDVSEGPRLTNWLTLQPFSGPGSRAVRVLRTYWWLDRRIATMSPITEHRFAYPRWAKTVGRKTGFPYGWTVIRVSHRFLLAGACPLTSARTRREHASDDPINRTLNVSLRMHLPSSLQRGTLLSVFWVSVPDMEMHLWIVPRVMRWAC